MNKQASLLVAAAHTAEVSSLKQSLERAEEELGLMKKKLEDNQGVTPQDRSFRCLPGFPGFVV